MLGEAERVPRAFRRTVEDQRRVRRCDGAGLRLPLGWTAPPSGTRSLALLVEDLSTPQVYTHWLAWAISPRARSLASGAHPPREGRNDFGRTGYGGPCPPIGPAHRY